MHGKTSEVEHDGKTIFAGIPSAMTCTRYHSLIVSEEGLPEELEVSARTADGDDDHGAAASGAADRRRAVSSGERADGAWEADDREFFEDVGWGCDGASADGCVRDGAVGWRAAQQQPGRRIGTVGVQDAKIAGALEVSNGRAVLVGNTTVTAKDHTAEVSLTRGGAVKVCATSGLHVTSGQTVSKRQGGARRRR